MRLLLDQNISYRLVENLKGSIPQLTHVKFQNLQDKDDPEIWQFAKEHSYTIVTFDADFHDLQVIKGFPPKIIWLKFGNTPRKGLEAFLLDQLEVIEDFLKAPEKGCLEFR